MRYTQQQVLTILNIDQSTFVYWMRAVPRIQRLKGRGCHFERRDLLALGAIADVTGRLGVGISTLAPSISEIFELFHEVLVQEMATKALVIEGSTARLERLPVAIEGPAAVAVLPLEPIVEKILTQETVADLLPLERLMFPKR